MDYIIPMVPGATRFSLCADKPPRGLPSAVEMSKVNEFVKRHKVSNGHTYPFLKQLSLRVWISSFLPLATRLRPTHTAARAWPILDSSAESDTVSCGECYDEAAEARWYATSRILLLHRHTRHAERGQRDH
jgi:hypothetical protein